MAQEVLLPKLGLTMEEGTIVEWVAKAGDVVKSGDVLLRLGTDKVDAEVEAEGEGRFEPVVAEGVTLPPGALIAWLLQGDEQPPERPSEAAVAAQESPAAGDVGELQLTGPATTLTPTAPEGRLLASPNAKRVAAEHGIDLRTLRGTGPGGRIVSEDVEDALARAAAEPSAAPAPAGAAAPGSVVSPLVRRHALASGIDLSQVQGSGLGGRIRRADVTAAAAVTPETAPSPAVAAGP